MPSVLLAALYSALKPWDYLHYFLLDDIGVFIAAVSLGFFFLGIKQARADALPWPSDDAWDVRYKGKPWYIKAELMHAAAAHFGTLKSTVSDKPLPPCEVEAQKAEKLVEKYKKSAAFAKITKKEKNQSSAAQRRKKTVQNPKTATLH